MQYVEEILALEWEMFSSTNNVGGKASCQSNYPTFKIMRTSQTMSWNDEIRKSYLDDLTQAKEQGRNLLEEKYARMMFFTHKDEYRKLEHLLPPINEDFLKLALEIAEIHKNFELEFSNNYPKLRGQGRRQDIGATTDIYLLGELLTYSTKTLILLREYVIDLCHNNKNLVSLIQDKTVKQYGYKSLEDAENSLT